MNTILSEKLMGPSGIPGIPGSMANIATYNHNKRGEITAFFFGEHISPAISGSINNLEVSFNTFHQQFQRTPKAALKALMESGSHVFLNGS